jgi:transposase
MNIIDELNNFVNQTTEVKEIKRALAAQMVLQGISYHKIQELLNVSHQFISKWKNRVIFEGVESLKLQFKGTKSELKPQEKEQVINWLREQEYLRLSDLKIYLEREYNIIYKSNQSYYNLLK